MTDIEKLKAAAADFNLDLLETVNPEYLDSELVSDLPVEWARANCLLPIRIDGELCVLTFDPAMLEQHEYIELLLGSHLKSVLAPREVIAASIDQCYYSRDNSPSTFLMDMQKDNPENVVAAAGKSEDLLRISGDAPVTQLINLILLEAVKRKASDIHFEPFEKRLKVRYRIDGVLYEKAAPPKHMEEALVSRIKVMAHMDIAEKRLPQDGMARVSVGDREIDIRVSTVPVAEGERVVLRILDKSSALLPLDVLGMSESNLGRFRKMLALPNGIIVVSGPTGSGKTTTLYAALNCLDSNRRNIITIEDPVEYQLPDIGQIQVKPKIGLTFASGLRHILRQDPDVVLVGETRDLETAEIAVRASLTGHLVFTTLHTNDAPGAVLRLVDMGTEPYLLSSCLRAVLAQRLIRKLCTSCRRKFTPTASEIAQLGDQAGAVEGKELHAAAGCPECLEGYSGRLGLFELMNVNPEMREVIRGGNVRSGDVRAVAERDGMVSLLSDGVNKLVRGMTSLEEVISVNF